MSTLLMKALGSKPYGTMIPIIATLPDNPHGEVMFVIKEDRYYIKKARTCPSITIRNSIIETDDALGFINMIMFNDSIELLYDCWLDYNNEVGRRMIGMLCTQERLIFEYVDSNMKKVKQFMIDNSIAPFAKQYTEHSIEYSKWDREEFDILKNSIYAKFPVSIDLWNELEII